MPLSKISDARNLSDQDLDAQITALKRQLFEYRMQTATRQTVKPHLFKHARHQLAQLLTVERERQLVAKQAVGSESQPASSVAEKE